jgi:hypothetical protein
MAIYLNRKQGRVRETIDEFSSYREAREMLSEYLTAFHGSNVYISSRPCANWVEERTKPGDQT